MSKLECGGTVCSKPEYYCDKAVNYCSPCDVLCIPRRFDGPENVEASCKKYCPEFYQQKYVTSPLPIKEDVDKTAALLDNSTKLVFDKQTVAIICGIIGLILFTIVFVVSFLMRYKKNLKQSLKRNDQGPERTVCSIEEQPLNDPHSNHTDSNTTDTDQTSVMKPAITTPTSDLHSEIVMDQNSLHHAPAIINSPAGPSSEETVPSASEEERDDSTTVQISTNQTVSFQRVTTGTKSRNQEDGTSGYLSNNNHQYGQTEQGRCISQPSH